MPVLVVADDSTTIQKVVELSFAREEIRVQCFEDGLSALEFLKSRPSSIVLADISLPLLNGYDLCRELRRDTRTAAIPVVLLSGTFEPFDVKLAEEVGYSGCLTKPFETSQLVELVESLLVSRPSAPSSATSAQPQDSIEVPGEPSPLLFRLPLRSVSQTLLFALDENHCNSPFAHLKRQLRRSQESRRGLSEDQLEQILKKVMDQLPAKLRDLIPEVAREVLRETH